MEEFMAEITTKKADNAKKETKEKRVRVKLPKLRGINAEQTEFFSHNGKNYRIKRGEYVEIPVELEEVIRNRDDAEEAAFDYAESISKKNNDEALK
jgi:hypothetical protein